MPNELLPCPFCGRPAAQPYFIEENRSGVEVTGIYIACFNDDCGCEMLAETREALIERWNKRSGTSDRNTNQRN